MMKNFKILLAAALLSAFFVGCEPIENVLETQSIVDGTLAQSYYDDVVKLTEEVFEDSTESIQGRVSGIFSCAANITINNSYSGNIDANTPAVGQIVIDFGAQNVLCNGRQRRGKIIITYSGKYRDAGTKVKTTFDNYFVGDHQVKGVKLIENKGLNAQQHLEFSVSVTDGEIIFPDGNTNITWSANRTKEWTEGQDTKGLGGWTDDVFVHNGTSSGVSRNGTNFSTKLTNVVIKRACLQGASSRNYYPVSGTKEITTEGGTRTLDFCGGNENTTCECDFDVSYTGINGDTYNLTLGSN